MIVSDINIIHYTFRRFNKSPSATSRLPLTNGSLNVSRWLLICDGVIVNVVNEQTI
jgi:hypothetical protein